MNRTGGEPLPWSRRRWEWSIGFVILMHLALLWQWSNRAVPTVRPIQTFAQLYLITDEAANLHLAQAMAEADPTLFALANPHGFSGEAWLNRTVLPHSTSDWSDAEHSLPQNIAALGSSLFTFALEHDSPFLFAPLSSPRLVDPHVPEEFMPTNSTVQFEGEIAARALPVSLAPPPWPAHEVLTDTVIQVLADASGETLTTQLLASSSLAAADQYALEIAKALRFRPLEGASGETSPISFPLTWGKAVFHWRTASAPGAPVLLATP